MEGKLSLTLFDNQMRAADKGLRRGLRRGRDLAEAELGAVFSRFIGIWI
jgi:hypothetical protein